MKKIVFLFLREGIVLRSVLCCLILGSLVFKINGQTINIDGKAGGKRFDGIGAVSGGGATSVLLKDYPEPQRSQILDLLFKPKFGASMSAFFVEIPGDGNSTQGTEPSHMHSKDDENYSRGYEWWLMSEAKKRNAAITLDGTAWSSPGWVGNNNYWSQDMCDYYVKWVKGLKNVYGLEMDAIGCRNEKGVNTDFAKMFRSTLNKNGLSSVKIHGFDNWQKDKFDWVRNMKTDTVLRGAVDILGNHTLATMPTPSDVRALSEEWGKPIWNTEEHVYKEGFDCEISLVQAFNKNFLESGATKIVNWYLVASVYGIEPFPITPGSMIAREPWSGNYATREVLWGYAHYGQFTEVGWQYLNGACGKLNDGGTYVTLKSPKNDYSIIIETKDASMSQQVDFIISDDLLKNKLCVWRSNASEQFVQLEDIAPVNGVLTITLDPKSIYSISTTSGQRKGTFGNIPESKPFPFPYYENFESYKDPKSWGYLPHYTADIAGVFEIAERPDKKGNCLRQVIGEKAQSWAPEWRPYTVLGDQNWTDYEISADIYLDNGGMAGLMGRLNSTGQGYGSNPKGYYMGMNVDGTCTLYLETQKKDSSSVQLATGIAKNVAGKQWHNLKLQFQGSRITGFADNVQVLTATDATFPKGMVGMITGGEKDARNTAYFDNLMIKPIGAPVPEPTKFIQDVNPIYPSVEAPEAYLKSKFHGMFVPVNGKSPVPVDRLRADNPAVLPMTGTWKFRLEHGESPAIKGEMPVGEPIPAFALSETSDADWKNIPVPANWEIEGFSIPTYQERSKTPSDDIGLYRRWVDVPASFKGLQVFWHFDAVYDGAEIFVNGQRMGYHESGFTAFDVDVTKAIKPGQRNFMAVRVYKKTYSGFMDKGDFWCLGGIPRETFLVALPTLHVNDVMVVTDLDAQYKNATLSSTIRINGPVGKHFKLTCELFSLDGTKVPLSEMIQSASIDENGSSTIVLNAPVTAPKLWSAEKPNLYYVFYQLFDGKNIIERVQDRIGFRKVELKGGAMLVNGVPVKLAGVNRHDEYATLGHALNEECWQKDITLLKDANVNAIRTAHYNHSARFLELCDEAGFYVLDEVPFCWVAPDLTNVANQWAYLLRTKETLARDKNHASVVVWSCGNESGYGANAQASFDYMKTNDPTRLAFISQQGIKVNAKSDFDDYHYPTIPQINEMIKSEARTKVPAIYTENGGIEDPWGYILYNNWEPIWSGDGIAGAFIWEWQEQYLLDKFPERWSVSSPGARGIDITTGKRTTNGGGAVTAERQPKPNRYWNLKMVYSPVTTYAREVNEENGKFTVPILNRYSFTNLSELTCRWQALDGGKELAAGESHIAAKPRSSVDATFPVTPGMKILRLEFFHPDGRSIYATRLRVKGYDGSKAPATLVANGAVSFAESGQSITVMAAGTKLVFDKKTAQIASWRAGDKDIIIGGPIFNLGETLPATGGGVGFGGNLRGLKYISGDQLPQYRNPVISISKEGDNARLSVASDVAFAGSDEVKAQLHYTLLISPDAKVDFDWKLDWKSTDISAKEIGFKILLPTMTDQMKWFSNSLFTEYPADHIGRPEGSVTSKDFDFSTDRRNVNWLSLSGAGDYSLIVKSTDKPLHTHGSVEKNGNLLYLSSGIASTGRDVTGDDIRLAQKTSQTGSFSLSIATNQK